MSTTIITEEEQRKNQNRMMAGSAYGVFHFVAFILALYLSFKRNNGFNLGSFLVACLCPYIYIIYYAATASNYSTTVQV